MSHRNQRVAIAAVTLAIFAPLATSASAHSTARVVADSTAKFVGLWEGPYHADHGPPGGYRLEIAHDTGWKVKLDAIADQTIPMPVSDFRATGDTLRWDQEVMGMACKSIATLANGQLHGATDCGHVALTFELRKSQP
jgi:hypothetical protein